MTSGACLFFCKTIRMFSYFVVSLVCLWVASIVDPQVFLRTLLYFYRAMHFSAKRGIAIACRLSVRLSVRL